MPPKKINNGLIYNDLIGRDIPEESLIDLLKEDVSYEVISEIGGYKIYYSKKDDLIAIKSEKNPKALILTKSDLEFIISELK